MAASLVVVAASPRAAHADGLTKFLVAEVALGIAVVAGAATILVSSSNASTARTP